MRKIENRKLASLPPEDEIDHFVGAGDRMLDGSATSFIDYGNRIMHALIVGNNQYTNCLEYACVAIAIAHKKNYPFVWLCRLNEYDHYFVVFGPRVLKGCREFFMTHSPLYHLDQPAFVCDGWANITCNLREYLPRLSEKLNMWDAQGKRYLRVISMGGTHTKICKFTNHGGAVQAAISSFSVTKC
jgi:hypothetical protein